MAYDEKLAARVRRLLSARNATERAMFGGLRFMVAGRMCCGVNNNELIVRLHPDDEAAALAHPHARPMDFTGPAPARVRDRRVRGAQGAALSRWVGIAVAHAESLPPKREEARSR
jgi:TfoX/Sxy family transcriptional regulator of competence genes